MGQDGCQMRSSSHRFMTEAIRLSRDKLKAREGGPFGALIVKGNKVIAAGWNRVTSTNDPTTHAEIVAIRAACRKLKTFSLKGSVLYSSCEPCPMCLAAIYWARITRVYYAATSLDAARIGFDDHSFYQELKRPPDRRRLKTIALKEMRGKAIAVLQDWEKMCDKVLY